MKKKVLSCLPFIFSAFFSFAQVTDTTRRPTDTTATGGGMATEEDSIMMDTRINPGSLDKKDVKFLVEAASSSRMQTELGQLAQQKATSPEVKNYAAMIVNDHTKASQDIMSLVSSKGGSIPDTLLLSKHRVMMDRLNGLEGADFDKAFMSVIRDTHENDIEAFENETRDAKDPDVRAFATKQLPILQEHQKQAKDMKGMSLNNSTNNSSSTSGSSNQ